MKVSKIDTGYLFTKEYSKGELETLSIGDYGRENNIKADFLGYTKEIHGVPFTDEIKKLSEKWVMTLSTQYGCAPMKCKFCDVPKIPFKGNASFDDLYNQFKNARKMFSNIKYTERLNLHYARAGCPMANFSNVYNFSEFLIKNKKQVQDELELRIEVLHPVFTTAMPKPIGTKKILNNLLKWCELKNTLYNGQAGLQISINSTDDEQRDDMFNNLSLSIYEIAKIVKQLPDPLSRKYCLNFAYASNYIIDADKLISLFNPEKIMIKITPIHNNTACRENKIETINGYKNYTPYKQVEENLKNKGFDVLVFVPSMSEERNKVTCGNLVLATGK